MSPGRKKRFLQNDCKKGKAIDSTGNEYASSDEIPSRITETLDNEAKDAHKSKETSFKKYSKRKVVSNWNRYDEIPDCENEELRGTDYEVALTCSSGAVSQFRFEVEKEWEDESLQIDASDFTSIDCDALASALGCIPFHKRLGISEDVFVPEMIEEFCANAALQRNTYVPPVTSVGSCLLSNTAATSQPKVQNEINSALLESLTSCLNIKNEPIAVTEETDLEKTAQKKVIDSELDFLLSLSENTEKSSVPEKINNLLQGDPATATETKSCKSLVMPSSEINIDDWLDNIVDD